MTDTTGREPALPGDSEITGREPGLQEKCVACGNPHADMLRMAFRVYIFSICPSCNTTAAKMFDAVRYWSDVGKPDKTLEEMFYGFIGYAP